MSKPVTADTRNIGKRVRYTFRHGMTSHTVTAVILRFRGNTRGDSRAQFAWIRYETRTNTVMSVPLNALEYV